MTRGLFDSPAVRSCFLRAFELAPPPGSGCGTTAPARSRTARSTLARAITVPGNSLMTRADTAGANVTGFNFTDRSSPSGRSRRRGSPADQPTRSSHSPLILPDLASAIRRRLQRNRRGRQFMYDTSDSYLGQADVVQMYQHGVRLVCVEDAESVQSFGSLQCTRRESSSTHDRTSVACMASFLVASHAELLDTASRTK